MTGRYTFSSAGKILFLYSFCLVAAALSSDTLLGQTRTTFPSSSLPLTSPVASNPGASDVPAVALSYRNTTGSVTQSGASQALSIEQLVSRAVDSHPAIQQAALEVDSYRGSMIQAGLKKNPVAGYVADEMGGYKGAGRQGLSLSQEIVPNYKRSARQNVVGAEQGMASQALEIQRQKVVNDATLAGYRLLIAQNKEILVRELLTICEKSVAAAESLMKANEVPKTDYLQAKIELNKAKMALSDVRLECQTVSKEIAILLAVPEDTSFKITDSLDKLPLDLDANALFQQLLEQSPQLRRARAGLVAAQARVQREQAESGLDFNVEGSVLYNTYDKQTEVSAGLSIPLRINDRNQGNIMRAQYEVQAANSNIERVKASLQSSFQAQIGRFNIARQRVKFYQESVLTEVDESLQLILQSYQQGQSSYIELLNAQRTMFSAKIEYMDSMGSLLDSRAMISGYLLQGAYDIPE